MPTDALPPDAFDFAAAATDERNPMRTAAMPSSSKPDYGIDAPAVVRNLLLVGTASLVAWLTAVLGLWSGQIVLPIPGTTLIIEFKGFGVVIGVDCLLIAAWMLRDSLHGKIQARDRLMDRVRWTGSERVLDVGCGRGLLLVGAAKRLVAGRAIGLDLWQAEDLSGNGPEAPIENARREGVADRVEVVTGDMRDMPFADGHFDVIVSRAAIHNLYSVDDRATALREIGRVLADGGCALIWDIRHGREYAQQLARAGCTSIERVDSRLASTLATILTFGSLRPVKLVARKPPRAPAGSPGRD